MTDLPFSLIRLPLIGREFGKMLYKASEILRGDHSVLRPLTSQKDLYTACLTLSASNTIVHLPASANVNISLSHRMAKQCWPLPLISDEPAVSNSTSFRFVLFIHNANAVI